MLSDAMTAYNIEQRKLGPDQAALETLQADADKFRLWTLAKRSKTDKRDLIAAWRGSRPESEVTNRVS